MGVLIASCPRSDCKALSGVSDWVDSTQSLVQINLYQSQIHPPQRGFVRESRAPGGAQCRAGRRATAGREVGRGERRAAGQVSRGRLILGWTAEALAGGGRRPVSVAVAWWRARRGRAWSSARCVRRVWAGGWAHPRALGGPPSRRVAAPSVLPTCKQCSGQQPVRPGAPKYRTTWPVTLTTTTSKRRLRPRMRHRRLRPLRLDTFNWVQHVHMVTLCKYRSIGRPVRVPPDVLHLVTPLLVLSPVGVLHLLINLVHHLVVLHPVILLCALAA